MVARLPRPWIAETTSKIEILEQQHLLHTPALVPRRRPARHRKSSLWRRRREDPHTHRRAKLLAQPAALLPEATLETEPLRCGPVPAAVEPAREGPKQAHKVRKTWNLQAARTGRGGGP